MEDRSVKTTRTVSPIDKAIASLSSEGMKKQFTMALPSHLAVNAERYVRQFCTQIRMNPKLIQCEWTSLLGAMMTGCALGLDPSPALGEFYIIPYGKDAQFQISYRGLLSLAFRGGIKQFAAHAVHEKDEFEYELGDNPHIKHRPFLGGDRGRDIAYYATAKLPSGDVVFEIMSKIDIEDHAKQYSKSWNSGPWKTAFPEMAKKTVARRLMKWIPHSVELGFAIVKDGTIARIAEGEIRTPGEVLEADVHYVEPDADVSPQTPQKTLAAELMESKAHKTAASSPVGTGEESAGEEIAEEDGFLPMALSQEEKLQLKAFSAVEKLREDLTRVLSEFLKPEEVDAWLTEKVGGPLKSLKKEDLQSAIATANAELDKKL